MRLQHGSSRARPFLGTQRASRPPCTLVSQVSRPCAILNGVAAASAGDRHSLALGVNGRVYGFGETLALPPPDPAFLEALFTEVHGGEWTGNPTPCRAL